MSISGEKTFDVSREALWAALNDPEMLQKCVPGCDELTVVSDTEFNGVVELKLGPVKVSFKGQITLCDLDPPNSYRLVGSGDGGLAGDAKGSAAISLQHVKTNRTQLIYELDPTVGGKIAQIGQRMIKSSIQKMADQFLTALYESLATHNVSGTGALPAVNTADTVKKHVQSIKTELNINGTHFKSHIEPRTLLVEFIRDVAGLKGTRVGCETSQCGTCTVHLDGQVIKACSVLAVACAGKKITTIEGVASEELHPLQLAFREHHALQCGYCTSGMIMVGLDLIHRYGSKLTEPTIRQELKGNLCRCTGYTGIVTAIKSTANASE